MMKLVSVGAFCFLLGACAAGRPTGGGHVVGNGLVPEGSAVVESHSGGCTACSEKKSCGCEKETCSCGGAAAKPKKK